MSGEAVRCTGGAGYYCYVLVLSCSLGNGAEVEHAIVSIDRNDLEGVLCTDLKSVGDVEGIGSVCDVLAVDEYDVLCRTAYSIPGKSDLAAGIVIGLDLKGHSTLTGSIGLASPGTCSGRTDAYECEREDKHSNEREKLTE